MLPRNHHKKKKKSWNISQAPALSSMQMFNTFFYNIQNRRRVLKLPFILDYIRECFYVDFKEKDSFDL